MSLDDPTPNCGLAIGQIRDPGAPDPQARAFTLVELLVVISVIGLLISIVLPALSRAHRSGAQVRETAAIRQFGVAYAMYAHDNRGVLLPGYTRSEWVAPGGPIEVFSSDSSASSRLYGSVARRFTWRLAAYLGYARDGLVLDSRLRAEFNGLPDSPGARQSFQWAFGTSPSFGINSTFVGGDARRGGFCQPSLQQWGRYYVTRLDEPQAPDKLLIFATSRGYHPVDGTTVIPGRHRIEGPWQASRVTHQVPTFAPWEAPPGPFDPGRTPRTYGHLDFRHFGKALVTTFDGHVEAVGTSEIADMRRWSNQAVSPDWSP